MPECPRCSTDHFHLYPYRVVVKVDMSERRETHYACAGCLGHTEPLVEAPAGDSSRGRYRTRRTPYSGSGSTPVFEYKPPADWSYPQLVEEREVDSSSVVRIVAMEQVNKYGNCYEAVYVNVRKRIMKQLWLFPNADMAREAMPEMIRMVRDRKAK